MSWRSALSRTRQRQRNTMVNSEMWGRGNQSGSKMPMPEETDQIGMHVRVLRYHEIRLGNIEKQLATLSRQLISEAMILFGNLISNFTKVNKIPVPYRVQQRIDKVSNDNIQNSDNKVLYNFLLKKTLGKSYYSINPMPHSSLGLTSYLPKGDNHSYDIDFLSNRITIALGGRAAEDIIFSEVTTGASNDIQQATETIRNMICNWGMSKSFGPIVFGSENQHNILGRSIGKEREYSELTAEEIDKEMRKTVKFHDNKAKKLLRENIEILHKIADVLIKEETIDGSYIMDLIAGNKSKTSSARS